jgi:hypothetical protein
MAHHPGLDLSVRPFRLFGYCLRQDIVQVLVSRSTRVPFAQNPFSKGTTTSARLHRSGVFEGVSLAPTSQKSY